MTKKEIDLVKNMLRSTTSYHNGDLSFEAEEGDIIVWSIDSVNGCFHETDIVCMCASLFHTYIKYNKEMKRCELVIF